MEWNRKKCRELKEEVFNHYGQKCACILCPLHTKPVLTNFLTIDHIDNDGYKKKMRGLPFYRWIIANNFPSNLQILCWNCNNGKNNNSGICPHVSISKKPIRLNLVVNISLTKKAA